jgi:rhodanese-related sulfurtransferase
MLKKFYSALFVSIFFLIVAGLASPSAAADAQRISKDELRAMMSNPDLLIIDVRTEKEWKKADKKIKGAVWEDSEEVKTWAAKYPRDKAIALYCS